MRTKRSGSPPSARPSRARGREPGAAQRATDNEPPPAPDVPVTAPAWAVRAAAEAPGIDAPASRSTTKPAARTARELQALGRSAALIAHDFNNLLTVIIGNLERLAPWVRDDPRARRLAAEALQAAELGERMAEQLLAYLRRRRLEPRPVDVNALLTEMEDLLARLLGPAVELRLELAPDLRPALADPHQLERAILNLVLNARDAMPQGGVLSIATANVDVRASEELAPGAYVRLAVRDTGTGMPPEVAKRAFEPFFTTKPRGAGTGLGLSMVHGFAHQSGGRVTIDSRPGRGTAVSVELPRAGGGRESA